MYYKTLLLVAIAIGQAAAVATNPVAACQKPNNAGKKAGDSCGYFSTPSTDGPIQGGHCRDVGGRTGLECR
ncbi:hypothetical protein BJX65DRAFT_285589 [Aspergillus insuetus]